MLKRLLEEKIDSKLTDDQFKEVCKGTKQDIMFNRAGFGKRTKLNEMLEIASIVRKVREHL